MANDDFELRSNDVSIDTPPRLTGNYETDYFQLNNWFNKFVDSTVTASGLLDPVYQAGGAATVDVDNLANPANTTLAISQETANQGVGLSQQAVTAANNAVATADAALDKFVQMGEATISGTDSAAEITFSNTQPDTDYFVPAPGFVGFTGTPVLDVFHVTSIVKATDKFTVNLNTAPGSGNSVTFNYLVVRE